MPLTPPKTPKSVKKPYPRRYGPTLNLHDSEIVAASQPHKPASEEAVHPELPALFFRFWTADKTHVVNSTDGFIAGRYVRTPPRRGPFAVAEIEAADIINVRISIGENGNSSHVVVTWSLT